MATPTPSTNTPSKHLPTFSSPAPRSVPHTGNTNMMSYDSPAVLNILHDASSGMGGVGMGISMSGLGMSSLGMSASAMGRADEAERSRRLRSILDIVGGKPGRVSEEGLLALCKKMGVSVEKNTAEAHSWMLLIGDEAVCDITFKNDEIATVNLQTGLDGEQEDLQFGPTGSEILVRSLKPLPGQSKINVTLERFAANLDKLLTLDKLGAPQNGGVSCYNAIAGVYTSLRKLFEHEKKMALALIDANASYRNHKAEREVLCKKSGRPRLNGGSCLGLSLEYWMDRRHLIAYTPPQSTKGKEKTPLEPPSIDPYPEDHNTTNTLYSLTIECEASPSTLYDPIRISPSWISDAIEKPPSGDDMDLLLPQPTLDWLDPKPTYLDASDSLDPGRLPNIRFVARFNPPLVVPYSVHMQLFQSVGMEPRIEDFRASTFVGLALRPGEMDPGLMGAAEATHVVRSVTRDVVREGQVQEHAMGLFLPKIEYSRTLDSLPFSHPKQLVQILPTLRQYAFTSSVLRNSFYQKSASTNIPTPEGAIPVDVNLAYTPPSPRLTLFTPHPSSLSQSSAPPSLTSLLSNLLSPSSSEDTPPPTLSITLDIHPNAEIVVAEQNVVDAQADADGMLDEAVQAKVRRLGSALDVVGDLGVWSAWVRGEAGKQ
jgi:hypothetical protein